MTSNNSGRVFILGAGASKWAGFPLGKELWSFLLDHAGPGFGGMEFIQAHRDVTPVNERESVTLDLELLLTKYQSGEYPRFNQEQLTPVATREGLDDFRQHCRHLQMRDPTRVERLYDSLQMRRPKVVYWHPSAMRDLLGDIARAFAGHHDCIRNRRGCQADDFGKKPAKPMCPCFPTSTLRQQRRRILAALSHAFRPGDTIITFNWECLLESLLWREGLWSPKDGYGLSVDLKPSLAAYSRRPFPHAARRPSKILLLKPHGSINWATTPEGDQLALELLDRIFGFPFPQSYFTSNNPEAPDWPFVERMILAPVYTKAYHQHPLLPATWDLAIAKLSQAREITVIGYSLPPSDYSSRELLAYALRQNKAAATINVVTPERIMDSQWAEFAEHNQKRVERVAQSFEEWILNLKL